MYHCCVTLGSYGARFLKDRPVYKYGRKDAES